MSRYVVKVLPAPHKEWRYLCALAYDPFQRGDEHQALTRAPEDAFVFRNRAAAEIAACFVGGIVVRRIKRPTAPKEKQG